MKLKVLHRSRYKIAAAMDGDECETLTFLNDVSSKYRASAEGLIHLIERIADHGLDSLSTKLCHLVDKENKIYELIKGDLRLLFFKGHCDVLVITSHGFLKKSQKTPDNEKNKAVRLQETISASTRCKTHRSNRRSGGINGAKIL